MTVDALNLPENNENNVDPFKVIVNGNKTNGKSGYKALVMKI